MAEDAPAAPTAPAAAVPIVMRRQQPGLHACLAAPFHRYLGALPDNVQRVPSMMIEPERAFLHHLAKSYYRGRGLIVDGGALLGASTACFAEGLKSNPFATRFAPKPVVTFERAIVTPNLPRFLDLYADGERFEVGQSFEALLRRWTAEFMDLIDLRIGDIVEVGKLDAPIEILFLDVLKEPAVSEFAVMNYFPRLIPGVSIVVHQDYFTDNEFWIREHQEALGHYFQYIGEIGSTGVFLCRAPIPPRALRLTVRDVDPRQRLKWLAAAEQRSIDPYRRLLCSLARVRRAAEFLGREEAGRVMGAIRDTYPAQLDRFTNKRMTAALRAADYLCHTEWNDAAGERARMISAGQDDGLPNEDAETA